MATLEFKQNIEKYLKLDKNVNSLSKQLKEAREEKKKLEEKIVTHLKVNKMDKVQLNIGRESIRCMETRITGNLSMSLVFDTLCEILNNDEKAQNICDTIADIRDQNSKILTNLKIKPRV